MHRRHLLAGLAGLAGVGGAIGSGAFTSVAADRSVTVEVTGDADAFLGIEPASGPNGAYAAVTDGTATIDFETARATGVNPNATTVAKSVLTLTNQGTQTVGVSLAGAGDVVAVAPDESLTATARDSAVVARLDPDADDTALGVGEGIDVDVAVLSETSDLSGTLTVTATAESDGGAGGGVSVPEDGLVAQYPFDNDANLGADTVGDNDGTLRGDPTAAEGLFDGAVELDGDDDYVEIGGVAGEIAGGPYSVSAWVQTTDTRGEIASFNTDSGQNRLLFFQKDDESPGGVGVFDTDNSSDRFTGVSITDGSWHHVAYTLADDDTLNVYVDGTEELSITTSTRVGSNDILSVGQEFDGSDTSNFLDGRVDELRVYDRALSASEIGQLATRP